MAEVVPQEAAVMAEEAAPAPAEEVLCPEGWAPDSDSDEDLLKPGDYERIEAIFKASKERIQAASSSASSSSDGTAKAAMPVKEFDKKIEAAGKNKNIDEAAMPAPKWIPRKRPAQRQAGPDAFQPVQF
ncbi:unnamed protein product [Polarella glacialis]|uniref:Uncharacterized protein n=1 Tax=Polarella glacialis TaxID=89957 RepID=A0A813D4Z7_POLGL|nr:unnamed protein product [Polarella glacialis]